MKKMTLAGLIGLYVASMGVAQAQDLLTLNSVSQLAGKWECASESEFTDQNGNYVKNALTTIETIDAKGHGSGTGSVLVHVTPKGSQDRLPFSVATSIQNVYFLKEGKLARTPIQNKVVKTATSDVFTKDYVKVYVNTFQNAVDTAIKNKMAYHYELKTLTDDGWVFTQDNTVPASVSQCKRVK